MLTHCRICKTEGEELDAFCQVCNYPLKGTKQEQASFGAKFIMQKGDVKDSKGFLQKARVLLFVLGGILIIGPFIPFFSPQNNIVLIINVIIGLFFIGCGLLSLKKPKIALLIPLVTIVTYYLLLLVFSPYYLWHGLLWKTIILVILSYGYFSVRKADKILKKYKYIAEILEEEELNKTP
jgi:O-antigen/teichoic acid export membrane protein